MTEEADDPGPTGAEAADAAGADPVAAALALGGASREKADAFLDDQRALAADQRGHIADQRRMLHIQMEELRDENPLKLSHLRIRRLGDYARMAFEVSIGLLMLAAVSGLGLMVWNAAHAEGLIIEAFSVPPDLANRGITGQVVASQMLDQLTNMQNITQSSRPGRSYANSWGDDLKVEIPDTGISVGEAYRFLRGWLGHETHVSGEITRTATGIAIAARTGGSSGATFTGAESDLDALVLKSAEQIYGVTQPDRYARYLFFPRPGWTPHVGEARSILNQMVRNADPAEKPWAWIGLGILARYQADYRAASFAFRKALAANPDIVQGSAGLALMEAELGHPESALSAAAAAQRLLDRGSAAEINPGYVGTLQVLNRHLPAFLLGDYLNAVALVRPGVDLARPNSLAPREVFQDKLAYSLSLLHDGAGMRAYWDSMAPSETPLDRANRTITRLRIEGGFEHYQTVVASEPGGEEIASALGDRYSVRDIFETQLRPLLALAKAKLGDMAGAQALIAASPLDCYDCVRIRGLIAMEANQPERANYWFARAVHDAPSIPMAYTDWGRALLERGKPDEAITQFKLANKKGPHFADPLELWGEALMAKNQSHLALAKFAEAEKCAPNWGRLHLKWGQALFYAGKKDQAKAKFARATILDLTLSEKSELRTDASSLTDGIYTDLANDSADVPPVMI